MKSSNVRAKSVSGYARRCLYYRNKLASTNFDFKVLIIIVVVLYAP